MLLEFFKEMDKQMPKLEVKKILDFQKSGFGKKIDQGALMQNLMSQLKQKIQS
jgi:hypothetical protein